MAGRGKAWAAVSAFIVIEAALSVHRLGWMRGLCAGALLALWICAVFHLLTVAGRRVGLLGWLLVLLILGPFGAAIYFLVRPYDQWHYSRRIKALVRCVSYAVLIVLGTIFTLPFFWLLSTSFKPSSRIQQYPPDILPMQPVHVRIAGRSLEVYRDKHGAEFALIERLKGGMATAKPVGNANAPARTVKADDLTQVVRPGLEWSNYTRGLVFIPFFAELRNTLIISLSCVFGTILSCSLVAYGLSKIEWKGRNLLFIVLLCTMMLPAQVTMIPVFTIFVKLHWVDTFLPLIAPSFLGSAFFIFLLRQFFLGIPRELSEAAKLDGCSEFAIYRRIVMPLSKPALATVSLFSFLAAWNDFMGPLIYLLDESRYTLSLGLAMFTGQYGNEYGMLMAVSAVFTLPIIVLFFFTQRTFIQGMTMSGIKG